MPADRKPTPDRARQTGNRCMQLCIPDPAKASPRPRILYKSPRAFASLDACRITVDPADADTDSQNYRFKRHRPERSRLLEALPDIKTTLKGKHRFMCCGEEAAVEYSPELKAYRVKSQTCGHRWCPACRERFARSLRERITTELKNSKRFEWKFITLTQRSTATPLREDVAQLFAAFRRLRQTILWQRRIQYGVAVLEITLNPTTRLFHCHLHIIARGGFIPQKSLSRAWMKASNGSPIVDVRAITNATHAVHYVTKYVTKGAGDADMDAAGISAAETINALYRKKMVLWFGNRPAHKEAEDSSEGDRAKVTWIYISTLNRLLILARHGMPNASLILSALEGSSTEAPLILLGSP